MSFQSCVNYLAGRQHWLEPAKFPFWETGGFMEEPDSQQN